ncbi:MAG: T9SS type A sorting domain-containing protein [Saprospiraceae bacterium]
MDRCDNKYYERSSINPVDTLHIGLLAVQFDRFIDSAEHLGLISADTSAKRIYDVLPRPLSPYFLDTALIVTSLSAKLTSASSVVSLNSDDFLTNLDSLGSLEINLGSGFQSIKPGIPFGYQFPTADTFSITLRVISQTDTLLAHTAVIVLPPARPIARMMNMDSVAIDANGDGVTEGDSGGSLVFTYNEGCLDVKKNVIIFVGGYDPNNERSGEQVTSDKLRSFIFEDPGNPYFDKSVYDIIEEANLDIVFIDWADGGANMERNGRVVANAIQHINRYKAENGIDAPSVIVGQSMGGLCTKIGLHKLDSLNIDHNISKFFSWDTPHMGANVPVNMQAASAYGLDVMNTFLSNPQENEQYRRLDRAQNSMASRQLKFFHVTTSNRPTPLKKRFHVNTTDFDAFQAYYQSITSPVPHYAMSNGSGTDDQLAVGTGGTATVGPGWHIFRADGTLVGIALSGDITLRCFFRPNNFTSRGFYLILNIIPVLFHNNFEAATPNYDIIPASQSDNGLGELIPRRYWKLGTPDPSKSVIGFYERLRFQIYTRYFAFVPTFSSQQLPTSFSTPVSQGGGDITASVVSRSELVENKIKGDPGPDEVYNHEHVSFTPQIADFFVQNAIENQPITLLGINDQSDIDIKYNYGVDVDGTSTPTMLGGVRSVLPAAALYVNRQFRIRDISNSSNSDAISGYFRLDLSDGACYPIADITLQSGAEFIVGDDQNRIGEVYAKEGSRVTIKDGGKLTINDASTFFLKSKGPDNNGGVVIETGGILDARNGGAVFIQNGTIRVKSGGILRTTNEGVIYAGYGGRIILEDGAIVDLEGGDEPEGEGQIWIHTQGTLEIQGDYSLSGNGYFHFSPENYVVGPGPLKITNSNRNYRRMVLDASTSVILTNGQEFYARNAEIQYGNSSSIILISDAAADVRSCVFQGGDPAIVSNLTGKVNIRHSDFIQSQVGVEFNTSSSAVGTANLRSCKFDDCKTGVRAIHEGSLNSLNTGSYPLIRSSEFVNCQIGLNVLSHPSVKVQGSSFTSSGNNDIAVNGYFSGAINMLGCEVFGYTSGDGATSITLNNTEELILDAGHYHDNSHVVTITALSSITMTECVEFTANQTGVYCIPFAGGSTIDFNGSTWSGTPVGVLSPNATITVTDTKANTFVHGGDKFLKIKSSGNITMKDDSWSGQLLPDGVSPDQSFWFDLYGTGSIIVTTTSGGCGSDCQNPDDCRRFCEYYPENKLCKINPPQGEKSQVEKSEMSLFPNPANGQVTIINLPENEKYNLTAYSSTGQVMQSHINLFSPFKEIETSELVSGFYMLQLSKANGETQQVRFSVAR